MVTKLHAAEYAGTAIDVNVISDLWCSRNLPCSKRYIVEDEAVLSNLGFRANHDIRRVYETKSGTYACSSWSGP
jgi:hypothetical protein